MEKPYQLKDLGQMISNEAKKNGLHLAEEAVETLAIAAYNGLKEWAKESAALTANPVDDLVVNFMAYADSFVIGQIQKLDLDHDGV